MMNLFQAAVLGILEGLTEFLPVSSTGHLILASRVLGISPSAFLKSFEIVIQLGAICAVVVLYARSFLNRDILKRLAVAFVPTAILGFLLYPIVKTYLLESESVVLAALAVGGAVLILFDLLHKEKADGVADMAKITYRQAFCIGLFQIVAVIPGVSRSAASIVGGLALGLRRTAIVEFSFLLAVPTMAAATGFDLLNNASSFSGAGWGALFVGFITAFLVALAVIRFLLWFVRTRTFVSFGIYRIALAAIFWLS